MTAPPYDVIDDEALAELRARDPHNVVHLTLEPDERLAGARYRRVARRGRPRPRRRAGRLGARAGRTSARTASSAVATGIVASLRVEPYATGTVLPHERTHAGPKEGRLRLLRATRAQLEPIFLLYDGHAARAARRPRPISRSTTRGSGALDGDDGVAAVLRGHASS